jgi:NADP-dependent 3-hydroxy acid dehydrogenase YdfG
VDAILPALELQDALQRFTTEFTDRVTQAMEELERSSQAGVRDEALRKNLLYLSSALEVASGLDPEVNLLDMIDLLGLMVATRAALPHMRRQKDGHVVNISSTAGRVANPDASVYAATKFGVGAFSEALRREVCRDNIRVTIIEPGAVATELREHVPDAETRDRIDTWARSMRQLQSEDIAAAILYAVSQPPHVNVNEILLRPTDQER